MHRRSVLMAVAVLVLGGCTEREMIAPEEGDLDPAFAASSNSPGAFYVMTNSTSGNEVLAYPRAANGTLGSPTAYSTGGTGTGAGLGSQGALVLEAHWLFAVNAGSNELSVFREGPGGLTLTDVVHSGGDMPISVTVHGRLVYVLNAGGVNNITGFTLSPQGELTPIPGSTRPLSSASPGPAQVEFNPWGRYIIVTEKSTNLILSYQVQSDGTVSQPVIHQSAGVTPFGFAFTGTTLVVSEAFGGAPDASATSSYIFAEGELTVVSPSVGTTETAACWTVITKNGKYAYVTNTGSGTVSGYRVGNDGTLTLLDADGVTGVTGPGSAPIDAALSVNSAFLYVTNSGNGTISVFRVNNDGSLAALSGESGLPPGAVGAAAR